MGFFEVLRKVLCDGCYTIERRVIVLLKDMIILELHKTNSLLFTGNHGLCMLATENGARIRGDPLSD